MVEIDTEGYVGMTGYFCKKENTIQLKRDQVIFKADKKREGERMDLREGKRNEGAITVIISRSLPGDRWRRKKGPASRGACPAG